MTVHMVSAGPCYLCRHERGLTPVVAPVGAPVCTECAIDLGKLISSGQGLMLYRVWRARDLPPITQPSSARWHATAAKVCLRAREYPVALRHAGLALMATEVERRQDDLVFALQHALEVALSPEIYRPAMTSGG
jgi:hypothetical protein